MIYHFEAFFNQIEHQIKILEFLKKLILKKEQKILNTKFLNPHKTLPIVDVVSTVRRWIVGSGRVEVFAATGITPNDVVIYTQKNAYFLIEVKFI